MNEGYEGWFVSTSSNSFNQLNQNLIYPVSEIILQSSISIPLTILCKYLTYNPRVWSCCALPSVHCPGQPLEAGGQARLVSVESWPDQAGYQDQAGLSAPVCKQRPSPDSSEEHKTIVNVILWNYFFKKLLQKIESYQKLNIYTVVIVIWVILLPCLVTRSGNHGSSGQVRI